MIVVRGTACRAPTVERFGKLCKITINSFTESLFCCLLNVTLMMQKIIGFIRTKNYSRIRCAAPDLKENQSDGKACWVKSALLILSQIIIFLKPPCTLTATN